MKYEIDIPADVNRVLMEQATATGSNVVHLIQNAVVTLVRNDSAPPQARRRPGLPLEAVEVLAPCDLPRSSVNAIPIERTSKRRPDPVPETA